MPELPEVENFRRLLLPLVTKESTLSLEVVAPNPPRRFLSPEDVDALNENCHVHDVLRKGKLIAIVLDCIRKVKNQKRVYLFVHMGMTGRISTPDSVPVLETLSASDYPPPHTHLKFRTDTAEACFSDPRKFGSIQLATDLDEGFAPLAPDALGVNEVHGLVGKQLGIKALLLDQKRVMSGVGNWVADEVLYQCEIHPEQSYLTEPQANAIKTKLQYILQTAIDCLDESENFPSEWLFHKRWGKRSSNNGNTVKDSKGRTVTFLTAAGRTSAIVSSIQKKKGQKPKSANTKGTAKNKGKQMSSKKEADTSKHFTEVPSKRKAASSRGSSEKKRRGGKSKAASGAAQAGERPRRRSGRNS